VRSRIGFGIAFLLVSCAAAQEQSSLAGRVVNAITSQPLNRAHVRLAVGAFYEPPSAVYGAMSNSEGRFSISRIPPGSYLVEPELSGYFYLPKSFTLVIKPGEHRDDFRIELTPRAILSGRVLDEHGEPVQYAMIRVTSRGAAVNLAMRSKAGPIQTNDLGEFRLIVPPGKYHIEARVYGREDIRPDGTLAPAYYADTFYPSAAAPGVAAELVDAHPG
jgi:hypothetical protein